MVFRATVDPAVRLVTKALLQAIAILADPSFSTTLAVATVPLALGTARGAMRPWAADLGRRATGGIGPAATALILFRAALVATGTLGRRVAADTGCCCCRIPTSGATRVRLVRFVLALPELAGLILGTALVYPTRGFFTRAQNNAQPVIGVAHFVCLATHTATPVAGGAAKFGLRTDEGWAIHAKNFANGTRVRRIPVRAIDLIRVVANTWKSKVLNRRATRATALRTG